MATINGSITLNGITDKDMELIWGFKAKHGGALNFLPNTMQPVNVQGRAAYNNVMFTYTTREGFNIIGEVINTLHKHEEESREAAR